MKRATSFASWSVVWFDAVWWHADLPLPCCSCVQVVRSVALESVPTGATNIRVHGPQGQTFNIVDRGMK